MELPENFWLGTGLFGLVAASVYISKRVYEHGNSDPISVTNGAQLVRKSVDNLTIAKETINPISSLAYACYARALVDSARQMAKDNELSQASKIRVIELRNSIDETEKYAKAKINELINGRNPNISNELYYQQYGQQQYSLPQLPTMLNKLDHQFRQVQ